MSGGNKKAPILVQAADVLLRARALPPGPAKDDLRQLAAGLLKLHRDGMRANVQLVEKPRHDGREKSLGTPTSAEH
jgi:hypothetical protein